MKNWDLVSFTMQNLSTQMPAYIYHLLYRNYDISFCLCAELKQLQLIPQVHYVSHKGKLEDIN